jgi:twinkle protein
MSAKPDIKPEVIGPAALYPKVEALWHSGLPPGEKTGWPSLDKHLSIAEGQLTIITGWPGSGKSEWLDALLVNLMHQGWYTAYFSPENRPIELHVAKVLEKIAGKPFGKGPSERMTIQDVRELTVHMAASRFCWIEPPEEESSLTVNEVIEAATPWLELRQGPKRALVIDPWNELEHWRPPQMSETEYVSKSLSRVRNWARKHRVHVFLVAHPQKMRREADGKLPIPKPDMISGSQHWWNKADVCITVYRKMDDFEDPNVEIHVLKVRFKHIGRPGIVTLIYDKVTGRYREMVTVRDVSAYRNKGADE